jgi:phage terminase large subunit-like protein
MLGDFFDGTTETLIVISKKNGKSTLLAAIALFHLITTIDAECVIAAASRDQATILFDQAAGFVKRSEGLQALVAVKKGFREIRSAGDRGRIRVLASDVDTADGVIPTLALVDELHRHRSADLYGVFRDGLGPRHGRMITISTAGDDELSPLGVMRTAAYALPGMVRRGGHRYVRSPDGAYAMHEWALGPDDDIHDMRVVKRANPAPWQTTFALARRHDSPSMTEAQWKRFACGIWAQVEGSWVTAEAWDACAGEVRLDLADQHFVGVDIGRKKDSSAVAMVGMVDNNLHISVKIRTPRPDAPVAVADARADVLAAARDGNVTEVVYDPHQFQESAELLEEQGLLLIEFPQTDARMAPASETFYELIMSGRVVHDGDSTLREHVLAAVASETERGVRISKRKSKQRIDAAIALAMAAHRSMFSEPVWTGPLIEVFG